MMWSCGVWATTVTTCCFCSWCLVLKASTYDVELWHLGNYCHYLLFLFLVLQANTYNMGSGVQATFFTLTARCSLCVRLTTVMWNCCAQTTFYFYCALLLFLVLLANTCHVVVYRQFSTVTTC